MIRIAIVDDEPVICSELESLIEEYGNNAYVEIETEVFFSGKRFVDDLLGGASFDLVLLDIEMNNGNGIYVGNSIRNVIKNEHMQIAFVSGKDGYDRQLFEFRPLCFVEKPAGYEEICKLLNKYLNLFGRSNNTFAFKSDHKNHWVQLNQVIYFESDDRKVKILCNSGCDYEFYGSMENVYNQVKSAGFMMIHKSFIINYRYVREFDHDRIKMSNGEWLPVSKHRKGDVLKWQIVMENGGDRIEV